MNAIIPTFDVEGAPLPAVYSAARRALMQCEKFDECQAWADKAEALASYARQANDNDLRRMCDRIQARAIHRCGELLNEVPPATGAHRKRDGTGPLSSRASAATEAGLSERQRKTALRVANVPADEFEKAVEADEPATVTALARMGTAKRPPPDYLKGRDPNDFEQATRLIGLFHAFNRDAAKCDLDSALRGLSDRERDDLRSAKSIAQTWINSLTEISDV